MTDFPPIQWDLAARAAATVAKKGPAVSAADRRDVVRSVRDLSDRAHLLAVEVTGLPDPGDPIPCEVIGRGAWLDLTARTAAGLMAEVGTVPQHPSLPQRAAARALALQLAPPLAWLSGKIVGQFDPYGAPQRMLVVAPNVLEIEAELGVVPEDFRLWALVHEQTHRLQFHAAPWLREHIVTQVRRAVEAEGDGAGSLRPSLPELLSSPAQRQVMGEITAMMSVLEGYAEVMMDRVGPGEIPTVATIRERFNRRRRKGGVDAVARRLMGFDAKLAQYSDGARFCRGVIQHAGVEGLNRVYQSADMLPTLDQLKDPASWVSQHRI